MAGTTDTIWSTSDLDTLQLPAPPDWRPEFNDEAGWRVFLDEDVFEWLTADTSDVALRKRAFHCLRELLVSGRCGRVKSVRGAAKGWLRTPLGGSGGFHFYLWWAPYGTPAVRSAGLEERDILVRSVRHHDDTGLALDAGSPERRHLVRLDDVLQPSGDSPFTSDQIDIATKAENPVRLVRGAPGSGKTTALWLAGSFATGTKAIYVTYSRGLARTAEDYFRAFGPSGTAIDVMTFEDLLVELADAEPGSIDFMAPTSGAEALAAALDGYRQKLGPWTNRIDELYAELHAHKVGRALPVEFRGVPSSMGSMLPSDAYLKARTGALGAPAAKASDAVGSFLETEGLVDRLFPGPSQARKLLVDHTEPPPLRFQYASALFVDEVQDLTPVEAMLVLNLAARVGVASGTMPSLLIAGDEGQTVRPTDFSWRWLADLIDAVLGRRLGARTDHTLSENLRAPRILASVIEHSREQYRRFDKEYRPGGMTYADTDQTAISRVLYCRMAGEDDWGQVRSFFGGQPSAQLVYPGYRVPADYSAPVDDESPEVDVATSDQVKGLDYSVVGVLDAGRRERELEGLAAQADANAIVSLWGRTLADQFRVAVSRATETLVLLDRGEEDFTSTVHDLIGPHASAALEEIDADGLVELLDDEVDPGELLAAQIEEVSRILDDDPERALRRIRSAHRIVERARVSGDLSDVQETETLRLHGVAAAVAVVRGGANLDDKTRRRYQAEAREWLEKSGLGDLYASVTAIDGRLASDPLGGSTIEAVRNATSALAEIARRLPELEAPMRMSLVRWVQRVSTTPLPIDESRADGALDTLDGLMTALENRHPELLGLRDACVRGEAVRAADSERWERALELHRRAPSSDDEQFETMCLEHLERWEEAADLHEAEGRLEDALRCVREIPDFERAARLAEDPWVVERMRWATELTRSTDSALLAFGAPITGAERAALEARLAEALDAAEASAPGEHSPRIEEGSDEAHAEEVEVEQLAGGDATGEEPVIEPSLPDADEPVVPEAEEAPPEVDVAPARQPLTTVAELAAELDLSVDDCLTLCTKLGVPARTAASTVPGFMAERVRQRAAREIAPSSSAGDEVMDPDLLQGLLAVVAPGTEVLTIAGGKPNLVVELDASGAVIQTKRSAAKGEAKTVPAWMFNQAWRTLKRDGSISNTELVKTVKRSSAVLALLAQLPEVEVESTNPTVLRMHSEATR